MRCWNCSSFDLSVIGTGHSYICNSCGTVVMEEENVRPTRPVRRMSPYERTKAQVYATGNKWAIENFNATH